MRQQRSVSLRGHPLILFSYANLGSVRACVCVLNFKGDFADDCVFVHVCLRVYTALYMCIFMIRIMCSYMTVSINIRFVLMQCRSFFQGFGAGYSSTCRRIITAVQDRRPFPTAGLPTGRHLHLFPFLPIALAIFYHPHHPNPFISSHSSPPPSNHTPPLFLSSHHLPHHTSTYLPIPHSYS